jgi:hypothetical protein
MPSFNTARTGNLLRKFIEQMRALESMRVGTCHIPMKSDKYPVKTLVMEDGEAVVKQW